MPGGHWLQDMYKAEFADPLQKLPPWFAFFVVCEFLFQLPLSVWALFALRRDSPLAPLGIGIFGAQFAFTTCTSLVEILAFDEAAYGIAEYPWQSRLKLCAVYGPYAVVGECANWCHLLFMTNAPSFIYRGMDGGRYGPPNQEAVTCCGTDGGKQEAKVSSGYYLGLIYPGPGRVVRGGPSAAMFFSPSSFILDRNGTQELTMVYIPLLIM